MIGSCFFCRDQYYLLQHTNHNQSFLTYKWHYKPHVLPSCFDRINLQWVDQLTLRVHKVKWNIHASISLAINLKFDSWHIFAGNLFFIVQTKQTKLWVRQIAVLDNQWNCNPGITLILQPLGGRSETDPITCIFMTAEDQKVSSMSHEHMITISTWPLILPLVKGFGVFLRVRCTQQSSVSCSGETEIWNAPEIYTSYGTEFMRKYIPAAQVYVFRLSACGVFKSINVKKVDTAHKRRLLS